MEKWVVNCVGDAEVAGGCVGGGGDGTGGEEGAALPPLPSDGCVPNSRSYIMAVSAGALRGIQGKKRGEERKRGK